jgi:GTP-binding protein Era
MQDGFRSGFVALIGRPNAGKSTLLNRLVGDKIAIVSDKPQTTRTRITGVVNSNRGQIVFLDTPGIHKPGYELNRRMMRVVTESLSSVDLLVLMADATQRMGEGDRFALNLLQKTRVPVFLVLNKIDLMRDKSRLLPLIQSYAEARQFNEVIPVSALSGDGVELLVDKILQYLPEGPALFPEDTLTDQSERALAAEFVREKVLEATTKELPFVTAVETELWQEDTAMTRIHCVIYVERPSHRPIIIGKGGARLKEIGSAARRDIERLLGRRVFLGLYVKVRERWRDDQRVLDELHI